MSRTPNHFRDAAHFRRFVLECALDERRGFLDAMRGCSSEDDERTKQETRDEIDGIRYLIAAHVRGHGGHC